MKNSLDKAFEEGKEEGGMEKAILVAREMLAEKEPVEKIMRFTGLTSQQIEEIRDER